MLLVFFCLHSVLVNAQILPQFKASGSFNEQQMLIENTPANTRILINAPLSGFENGNQVLLIFYALPNGNTIEQTFGKQLKEGDDWQYNIQQIGAQTRFLRKVLLDQTVVVAYLEASQHSWPLWKKENPDYLRESKGIVDDITALFSAWDPEVVLNGHSGGGRFIFSYLEAESKIPDQVKRIAFLDSNYGYEDSIHGPRLAEWLGSGNDKHLCTLAYNDSVVIYNGKPLVSPTGGTWYRSKRIKDFLARSFPVSGEVTDSLIWYTSPERRIQIILKTNPEKKIYHTLQVELNGFIHSILSGTEHEQKGYAYFGEHAYAGYLSDTTIVPIRRLNIPKRNADAETGSSFMKRIAPLSQDEREEEIFKALSAGNTPDFLRTTITLEAEFADSEGITHQVQYEIMPDYLSVGNDSDFCRIPMNPHTAQRLAALFGASLLTSKLSDHIYAMAPVKLSPFFYAPVGNANETVSKFAEHHARIEKQKAEAGAKNGELVAGIKKDVILSNSIAERPDRVVIYGWHKEDGNPIQPAYSGHIDWYVDYSHGIRLINNQVLIDGYPFLLTEVLKDPVLFKLFSDEESPMKQSVYIK
jgi:pimeloyl-ACP methyl ester carboxylesterase